MPTFPSEMDRSQSASQLDDTDSERQTLANSQAVKPLPPLPRGWSRIRHETGLFLRGIGLGIVVTFFQGIFTKNFQEPEKVAIRRSRITALLRTLIHFVPVGVAIFEIVLNLKGRFIGETFDKQSYFQFIAKAHEIAVQASIATILLSYLRCQISTDKGMPFGAFLSGLQFLQVSYLWSVELWSSIFSKDFQLKRKICFAVLMFVCITVAATAGPSSANLLIPRQGLWPIDPTYLAVKTTVLDLWPDRIDGTQVERECAVIRLDSQDEASRCPTSETIEYLAGDYGLSTSEESLHVTILFPNKRPGDSFDSTLTASVCHSSSKDQICATYPERALLHGFLSNQNKQAELSGTRNFDGYQTVQKNYYQPYTVASCVTDTIEGASDKTLLRFARISETDSEVEKDREIFSIPDLTKGQMISNLSDVESDYHVDWVDLPMGIFGTDIPGAVISSASMRNITTCTLNAGWGSSALLSSSTESATIYSRMSKVPSSWANDGGHVDGAASYEFVTSPNFANISNFSYPQRRINISKSWMEFLNPTVILPDNSTGKFISLLLSSLQTQPGERIWPKETTMALLLNSVFSPALADIEGGSDWEAFSDLGNATRTCPNCLVFEMEYSYSGWLYARRGTTIILAIIVMLAYCVLVIGHIIYSAIYGISSTAWDSTAELVALAMNSSPTKILKNTCAGIVGRQALKAPVRVLVTAPGHLELVFGGVKDQTAQTSDIVTNEKYGKLMARNNEDEEPWFNAQGTVRKRALFSEPGVRAGPKNDETLDVRADTRKGAQSDADSSGGYRLTRRLTA